MNIDELVYDLKEHLDTYCQTYDDYDMTYNQTEMIYYLIKDLENEKQKLKDKIKQAIIYIRNIDENDFINTEHYTDLLNILEKVEDKWVMKKD